MPKKAGYPEEIQVKGDKVKNLLSALSKFPLNSRVKLDRQWVQSYHLDQVFTIKFDTYLKETIIKEIY